MTIEGSRSLRLRGYDIGGTEKSANHLIIILNAKHNGLGQRVKLTGFSHVSSDEMTRSEFQCIRIHADVPGRPDCVDFFRHMVTEIWFPLRPTISWDFPAAYAHYYRFQRAMSQSDGFQQSNHGYILYPIYPTESWDHNQKALLIHRDASGQELTTYVSVFLLTSNFECDHISSYLVVNFDRLSQTFWWASVRQDSAQWPNPLANCEVWEQAVDSMPLARQSASSTVIRGVRTCDDKTARSSESFCERRHHINCQMRPQIWNHKLSLVFSIERLMDT
jgi:hypothetical protein